MPAKEVSDEQAGFSGGVTGFDSSVPNSSLFGPGPTQYIFGGDALLTPTGDLRKRGGTQRTSAGQVGSGSDLINEGFCWRQATTHTYLLACNGRLYSGGVYSLAMTWTDKGAIAAVAPGFTGFRDATLEVCYVGDGVDLKKFSAAGVLSSVATSPAVRALAVYNQRLFGVTGTDQTLYYSSLNNGDTLGQVSGGGGSAIVRTFSNQKLTGVLALHDSLALFHVSGVSRFSGITQDDISIQAGTNAISTDTGTVSWRSAVAVDGTGYFLSERGAFRITDDGVVALDTPAIPDPTIPILASLTATKLGLIDGAHDKATSTIRWALPSWGVFCYHYRLNAWSGPFFSGSYDPGSTGCSLFDGIDDQGKPISLLTRGSGVSSLGYMLRADTSTYLDDVTNTGTGGTAYLMQIKFRMFFAGSFAVEKAWRRAYILGQGDFTGTLVIWNTEGVIGTTFTVPAAIVGLTRRTIVVPLSGRSTYLEMNFQDNGSTALTLSRILVEGDVLGPAAS